MGQATSSVHHLISVGPKQLCALAHLGYTREAGKKKSVKKEKILNPWTYHLDHLKLLPRGPPFQNLIYPLDPLTLPPEKKFRHSRGCGLTPPPWKKKPGTSMNDSHSHSWYSNMITKVTFFITTFIFQRQHTDCSRSKIWPYYIQTDQDRFSLLRL